MPSRVGCSLYLYGFWVSTSYIIYGAQAEIFSETLHGRIGQEGKIERESLYGIFEFNPQFSQVFMYFLDICCGVYKSNNTNSYSPSSLGLATHAMALPASTLNGEEDLHQIQDSCSALRARLLHSIQDEITPEMVCF